ncbi:MAG TPA: DUF1499 domain-containing protein [Acetobacteraceae bacterium]|nr:DUF1499 domain-containing protein [Acetobacteraceae bacterium]
MTALAWLLGLILPACGADGAAGLPVPTVMDVTQIERPATPNTFLAGPAGMQPKPDLVVGAWHLPAPVLYEKARDLFAGQPRTYIAAAFPDQLQVHYVVRSALLNFPDLVTIQVNSVAADRSTLVIWSRSVYGRSDFGVNRERTTAWLAALQQTKER